MTYIALLHLASRFLFGQGRKETKNIYTTYLAGDCAVGGRGGRGEGKGKGEREENERGKGETEEKERGREGEERGKGGKGR